MRMKVTILVLVGSLYALSAGAVNVTFNFGAGFNDPDPPILPAPGNTGATLGQQRQILFQAAADVWGNLIDSNVTIEVDAQFTALTCGMMGATLGSAGPNGLTTNPGLMGNMVFYPPSLENALIGSDQDMGNSDIVADFNSEIDNGCLPGVTAFYYGLDGNNPAGTILLFPVVLHEIAHGLGFTSLVDETDGSFPFDLPSIFDLFIFDVDDNELWTNMTDMERLASTIDDPNVVWDGTNVTNNAGMFTATGFNSGRLRLFAPDPFDPGSSIAHFTDAAGPTDLLMEPVQGNGGFDQVDVTPYLFQDLGYTITFGGVPLIFKSSFEDGE